MRLQNQNLTFAKLSLQRVFHLSSELGKVEFPIIVKSSIGYDVIPVSPSYESDKEFIEILNSILKKFVKTSASTRTRFQGNRINEIGRRIEETIVNEMNKSPLAVKRLAKSGYPDIEISYGDLVAYLEIKTSPIQEKSGFRYFYYTSGTKINQTARHLLLDIAVTQENPGYWKVDKWSLSDLSKLAVKLKNEFNASKTDLMDERAKLRSS
jgi:hypothetical protein